MNGSGHLKDVGSQLSDSAVQEIYLLNFPRRYFASCCAQLMIVVKDGNVLFWT